MHRWLGNSEDSASQSRSRNERAAQRTVRAARETISNLPIITSDSEDEFRDCNTSVSLLNLDGDDDTPIMADAAELVRQRALPVDQSDFENDSESWKKEIKLKFEAHDVEYWFNSVEADMKKFGINRQWDKKDAIKPLLPENVIEECKPILRLSQADAGNQIYKTLKEEILSLFGSKDEDAFKKAMALRLTGNPSALGKKLLHIICPGAKPLHGCHCAKMVFGFWHAQLSSAIKSRLAGMKFNKDTYAEMFKLADEVHQANGGNPSPSVVAAVAPSTAQQNAEPTADTPQVAAFQRGGGRGGRGNRGGRGGRGRGGNSNSGANSSTSSYNQNQNQGQNSSNNNSNQNQKPHQRGQKHPDLPKNAGWACAQHWKKGKSAPYCSDPLVCQWVNVVAPRT